MNKPERNDNYFVSIGFAEIPQKGELDYENFPSKLCGLPIWLIQPEFDDNFLQCAYCSQNLYFLTQIYCPLENIKDCFHRMIYVFFCKECWKKNNAIKVLRVQLPEKSNTYNGDKLLMDFDNNEKIKNINKKVNKLIPEYLIDSCEERTSANKIYVSFYGNADEKSLSNKCLDDLPEDDDDSNSNDDKLGKMLEEYCKEQGITIENSNILEEEIETEFINKVETNIFGQRNKEDVIYELFSKVVSCDPKQVIRYCRDGIFPLWFCSNGMFSMKNNRCKNCGGELIFEFQVNHIFYLDNAPYIQSI
jgi:pre-rRNA-processing protein TSR4